MGKCSWVLEPYFIPGKPPLEEKLRAVRLLFISMYHLSNLHCICLLMFSNIPVNSGVCILTGLCPRCSHKDHKHFVKDTTITFNSINCSQTSPSALGEDSKNPWKTSLEWIFSAGWAGRGEAAPGPTLFHESHFAPKPEPTLRSSSKTGPSHGVTGMMQFWAS